MASDLDRLYTSSQVLAATGCTRKALRVYQDKGLIRTRVDHGKRRYGVEAFDRLRLIVGLREFGMPIANIARILNARDGRTDEAGAVAAELAEQVSTVVQDLSGRIEDMIRLRNDMIKARETLFGCARCTQPASSCAECGEQGSLDSISRVLMLEETPAPADSH